jgi:hypothetical protein
MLFFSDILQCYATSFALLRRTRTILNVQEIEELQGAIDELKILWPTQRTWEQKEVSVTSKSHNFWFEVFPQLSYLGRFFPFHGRSDRKVAQTRQAQRRSLLSHSELPFSRGVKTETRGDCKTC